MTVLRNESLFPNRNELNEFTMLIRSLSEPASAFIQVQTRDKERRWVKYVPTTSTEPHHFVSATSSFDVWYANGEHKHNLPHLDLCFYAR